LIDWCLTYRENKNLPTKNISANTMSPVTRFKVGLYSGCDSDATDCDVAFNIAIAATMHIIASENFRREDISKLSQQN
jgi:hypothetical protein